MNENAEAILTKRISSGEKGLGYEVTGTRINDSTIFFVGANTYRQCSYMSTPTSRYGAILKVYENEMKIVYQEEVFMENEESPSNILYQENSPTMQVYYYRPCQNSCKDWWREYQFNENYTTFSLKDADMGYHPDGVGLIKNRDGLLPMDKNCQGKNFVALSSTKKIAYGKYKLTETPRATDCFMTSENLPFYEFSTESDIRGLGRFSETKFVSLVKENKKFYLYFFEKEGSWVMKHKIECPTITEILTTDIEFIPLNENKLFLNVREGLYEIKF